MFDWSAGRKASLPGVIRNSWRWTEMRCTYYWEWGNDSTFTLKSILQSATEHSSYGWSVCRRRPRRRHSSIQPAVFKNHGEDQWFLLGHRTEFQRVSSSSYFILFHTLYSSFSERPFSESRLEQNSYCLRHNSYAPARCFGLFFECQLIFGLPWNIKPILLTYYLQRILQTSCLCWMRSWRESKPQVDPWLPLPKTHYCLLSQDVMLRSSYLTSCLQKPCRRRVTLLDGDSGRR